MAAPTGDILTFINQFNKDFDADIEKIKQEVEEAKPILASLTSITTPKTTPYPVGDNSVKTIGDLFRYIYDLEGGLDRTNKDFGVRGDAVTKFVDSAASEIYKSYLNDIDGKTLTPPDPTIKEKRKKIERALSKSIRAQRLNDLKKQQGKEPNLWSPGQYYFDVVMLAIKPEISFRPNYDWSSAYESDLDNKKATFNFSTTSFSKDGLYKKTPDKKPGYRGTDGQAAYVTFRNMLEKVKQDIINISSIDIGIGNWDENDSFPTIRTKYQSGTKAELKAILDSSTEFYLFESDRTEGPDNFFAAPDTAVYEGHYELISLYKAFIQAGDNYEYVTLPLKTSPPPPPPSTPPVETKVSATQSAATQSSDIFTFNVEDEKTFYCKDPKIEYFIVTETNDIPQPIIYTQENTEVLSEEDELSEEYQEIALFEELLKIEEDFAEEKAQQRIVDEEMAQYEPPKESPPTPPSPPSNTGSSPVESSGKAGTDKYVKPVGVSANDWKKNGLVVAGAKVPSNLSGPVKYDYKVKIGKTILDEYIPIIKKIPGYTNGIKLLAIIMTNQEGFTPKTRSYRTNNPGNIGNVDSGKNNPLKTLEDGIKLQLNYLTKVAKGQDKTYSIGQNKKLAPFFSEEIERNNGDGVADGASAPYKGAVAYLPGYNFTPYTGRIEEFVKIYATGARTSNSYSTMIVSWFRQNGYKTITEETTLDKIISINDPATILS
jgi:hypothetical protein